MNVTKITLNKIIPDANQPRKYFDEGKMGTLRNSIKSHGIKNPLILEIQDDGTFLIIDGERRFRAAKELDLKEVPALLNEKQNETERLIGQFHLQEMHEGWTAIEKAIAISKLSKVMNTSTKEIGKILGIPDRTVSRYIAFSHLVDPKNFQRSNVPIEWTHSINSTVKTVSRICKNNDIEFTRGTAKELENAIYTRVRNGELEKMHDMTKIKDSVKQNPMILSEFLADDTLTLDKMFSKTKAKGAFFLRNISLNCGYLSYSLDNFLKEKSVKVDEDTLRKLRQVAEKATSFVKQFED